MIHAVIVEDDPMVAQINKRYLEEFSMVQVHCVLRNGKGALRYLYDQPVDLAIMDVYMPELSGLDLLRDMRGAGIRTDVIMVTAANDAGHIDEILKLGVVDYLVKPFEYDRFRVAVEKFLHRRGILDSNQTLNQQYIDQMVLRGDGDPCRSGGLEKGLQEKTLQTVIAPLEDNPNRYFSCDELAEQVRLSHVTIRRYLNHLMQSKRVACIIDYETGGRPSMKYRVNRLRNMIE